MEPSSVSRKTWLQAVPFSVPQGLTWRDRVSMLRCRLSAQVAGPAIGSCLVRQEAGLRHRAEPVDQWPARRAEGKDELSHWRGCRARARAASRGHARRASTARLSAQP